MSTSLGELFDRSPQQLTKEDRTRIRLKLREMQEIWLAEKDSARANARRPKLSANATSKKVREIELPVELQNIKIDL